MALPESGGCSPQPPGSYAYAALPRSLAGLRSLLLRGGRGRKGKERGKGGEKGNVVDLVIICLHL